MAVVLTDTHLVKTRKDHVRLWQCQGRAVLTMRRYLKKNAGIFSRTARVVMIMIFVWVKTIRLEQSSGANRVL